MANGRGNEFDAGTAITPNRETHIRFDLDEPVCTEMPIAIQRRLDEIGLLADVRDCVFIAEVGWQLRKLSPGEMQEQSAAAPHIITDDAGSPFGGMLYAAGTNVVPTMRQRSETGLTYNAGIQSSGDNAAQKQVTAGTSWNKSLTADQTAFPGPDQIRWRTDPDRFAASRQPMQAGDHITVKFACPSGVMWSGTAVLSQFFTGPASVLPDFIGYGQYCAAFYGDGVAELYERGRHRDDGVIWRASKSWRWVPEGSGSAQGLYIDIATYKNPLVSGSFSGGIFIRTHSRESSGNRTGTGGILKSAIKGAGETELALMTYRPHYDLPPDANSAGQVTWGGETETAGNVKAELIRSDVVADARPIIQHAVPRYVASGTIETAKLSLPFYVTDRANINLYWWGDFGDGTNITVNFYCKNSSGVTIEPTIVTSEPGHLEVTPPGDGTAYYWIKFTLTSDTDQLLTPTLVGFSLIRDQVVETMTPGEFEPQLRAAAPRLLAQYFNKITVDRSIEEQASDNAQFVMVDLTNSLSSRMDYRGLIGTMIETEFDPLDSTRRSKLFRGYAIQPRGQRRSGKHRGRANAGTVGYPHYKSKSWDVTVSSMWQRLHDALSLVRFSWHEFEPGTELPYKVTDSIRIMLGWAGFPSSMIDIDDLPLRYFSDGTSTSMQLEPFMPLEDFIMRAAKDYLGYRLIFDENAGTDGKWRLAAPRVAPYTNLAHFTTDGPGAGKMASSLASYSVAKDTAFIQRGTLVASVKPPEGNLVIVTGTGYIGEDAGVAARLTQYAINVRSYNFLGLASGHPKYPQADNNPDYLPHIAPIVVIDPGLTTPDAVNWVTRRVFEIACFGRKRLSFVAPLLLINDPDDAELAGPPTRYRPLRYYDPVTVDGSQYLVLKCTPDYSRDRAQWAHYELEAPREQFS